MKQTKWQRLATIGLCSSLVINAFSGVTAVAETITIESSPTVASSAKEATSASSATQESTESSQETTETSREEVTQETEKPEEITKTSDSKIDMVDPLNNSLQNSPTVAPKATVAIPSQVMDFAIVDEENNGVALTTPITGDSQWVRLGGSNGLVGSVQSVRYSTTYAGKNVFFNRITIPGVNYSNTVNFAYGLRNVTITLPKWYKGLSFVKPSYSIYPPSFMISYKNNGQQVTSPSQIVDKEYAGVRINLISQPNVYQVIHSIDGGVGSTPITFNNVYRITAPANTAYTKAKMVPQTSTGNYNNIVYIYTTKRKVTENFVDINGTKITPPTGFTQGKQTVIDSDPYTFKQAGTLPDTYQADGKTYKFKGWYKGKTKPNTLTTTKAPSYAVTYDDNDDLNVVYEEIEAFDFPALTYQFGFVGEDGKLANPADINLTYDYKSIVFRGTGAAGSTVSFGTIANNQSGVKVGNLRQVTLPAKNIEQPTVVGWTGEAFANFSIKLPKYYKSLNLYDKTGKIDPKYPLPVKATVSSLPNNTVQPEAGVIADLTLTQRADGSFTPRETYSVSDSSVRYPSFLRRFISYGSGIATAVHQTISGPVYYHLTNRRVTENFVDATGTKIAPPTGFTQGKQTVINSDPYTFKQSGTLPDTYTTGGKTYKFKGWYKGKTKPNTLTTTKAPSYAVTYDDNDDLNVVYEEIEAFDFPALTYQFGFVGEDGKLANPADINITYDYTGIEVRGNGGADSNVSFKTIASNQSGTTVGNFKQVIFPASSIERPTTTGWNGDGFSEFSIKLPKYYESVNLYDKTGKINTNYPLPRVTLVESNVPDTIFSESTLISDLALTQKADKSYTLREVNVSMNPNIKYPNLISRNINSLDERDGNIRYKTIEGPIYYHLTNRRVTENFVDTNGTKITPPTGFTQGKQTVINSDPYTFKQSGTLPDTYTTGGKTYKFKGWYKGKTKPNTLTTSTTPTYNTTFDGNDDMTAMYKEEVPKASVALTR
ncbi:WxL domain-containing protein, partial [Enterococcus faecalis]